MKYAIQVLKLQAGGGYVEDFTFDLNHLKFEEIIPFSQGYEKGLRHNDFDTYKVNVIIVEGGE
jgi:hypothetical protein